MIFSLAATHLAHCGTLATNRRYKSFVFMAHCKPKFNGRRLQNI